MQLTHKYLHRLVSYLSPRLILAVVLVTVATSISTFAQQPGDLDPTFGNGGKVIDGLTRANDSANAVAVQPDGKIVVVGGAGSRMEVSRYNPDGSLDASFDGDGRRTISRGLALSVVIQSDGKIVIGGSIADGETWRFGVIRLNGNGSFDTSFDGDGRVVIINGYGDVRSVALQPDGKIVASGRVSLDNFALARYNPDGSLDTSFSGDGIVEMPEGGPEGSMATSVAIQSDGKILAGGGRGGENSSAVVRYNTDGTLDTGFGTGGVFGVNLADRTHDLAIQADGKIVAACTGGGQFALVRINANGASFDLTFGGGNGYVLVDGRADGVAIQPDGKIVVAGGVGSGSAVLWRFDMSGGFDTTFDEDGIANTGGSYSFPNKPLALQSDGKIVSANSYYNVGLSNDFHVGRLTVAGALDSSFGGDGTVTTDFGLWEGGNFSDVAIRQDGKIVAVGNGLARYNPDGSPDTSFGGTGKVAAVGESLTIQPDGKIVIAGSPAFTLARYNESGVLDTSFGSNGRVTTSIQDHTMWVGAVAVQPDGKIIAAGYSEWYWCSDVGCFSDLIVRYNADGSLDTTFGTNGIVHTPQGGNGYSVRSVVIQSDGKIVAAGGQYPGFSFAVFRYNTNGSPDTSFDGDGRVITPMGTSGAYAFSIAIQSDGKIVAAGYRHNGSHTDFVLARYNTNGSLDTTLDYDGVVISPIGSGDDWANSVAIQSDGKIVAAGYTDNSTDTDFALVRYNPNGSLDTTFAGGDGIKTVDFENGSNDCAYGMALDSQGRAVVAGQADEAFALARFMLEPGLAPFDFDGDGRSDISVFRPADSIWYLNQSTQGFSAIQFGLSTDPIVPADYDGDGNTDIAVFRDGVWWLRKSSNSAVEVHAFGQAGDIPVPADYTGDGRDDLAVYRNGQWWSLDLSNNQSSLINFGLASDKPAPADYDGDGRIDQAVYRNGEWHINRSILGYTVAHFGLSSDRPVVGDFDGDGRADLAVYREGIWYLQQSTAGFSAFQWGLSTDVPTPGDYDGDGKTDATVFRNGTWYLLQSTGGVSIQQFGITGDKPLAAAFVP